MKRILLMSVSIALLCVAMTSCSKDSGSINQNPLVGTLWEEEDDAPWHMEFIDATTVSVWGGWETADTGTYQVSGNNITFTGLSTDDGHQTFHRATFTNNTMIVYYNIKGLSQEYKRYLYKK
jgi:hypothetical protein